MKNYINKIITEILDPLNYEYLFFYSSSEKQPQENEIYINIPYFDKKDISITYDSEENKITVSIDKDAYKEFIENTKIPEKIKYSVNNVYNFYIHRKINEKSIQAELKNGILKITFEESKEGKYKVEIK